MKTILTIKGVTLNASERIHGLIIPITCKAGWAPIVGNIYVECTDVDEAWLIIQDCESDGFELDYRIDVTQ